MVDSKHCRFGAFEFIPSRGLYRDGEHIAVPPKELGLLNLLLRSQGEIVSQKQIESIVWPRQVVSYASITRCVYSLRQVLGNGGSSYIVTVPKQGYRLNVDVTCAETVKATNSVKLKIAEAHPLAYSTYLEGLRYANKGDPSSQGHAADLFEKAQIIDSGFAAALAAGADCRMYQAIRGFLQPREARQIGMATCEAALKIDPNLASAHAVKGWFQGTMNGNQTAGMASLELALNLDPEYARGYAYFAWVLRASGRLEESLTAARTAVDLDPHSILNRHALVWTLFCAGFPEEALTIERCVRWETPMAESGHAYAAMTAAWLGYYEEAIDAGREAQRISNGDPTIATTLTYALARAGKTDEASKMAKAIRSAKLPRAARPHLAMTYVALDKPAVALELIEEALNEGCPWAAGVRFDPRLERLAKDPRLLALMAK